MMGFANLFSQRKQYILLVYMYTLVYTALTHIYLYIYRLVHTHCSAGASKNIRPCRRFSCFVVVSFVYKSRIGSQAEDLFFTIYV